MDMLRSARTRQRSARSLIAAGALFGHTENTMRVNLSRLTARGLIVCPRRGLYSLARQTDSLNDFVERWRLGEGRIRPWTGGNWLFAHVEAAGKASSWALDALGFRAVREGLYARPDNLNLSTEVLHELAAGIGMSSEVLLLCSNGVPDALARRWFPAWQPAALNARYHDGLARLAESTRRLRSLPPDEARLESFALGGTVIHQLAKDPLLPDSQVEVSARRALWQAMLSYDALGQEIWAEGKTDNLLHMPRPQLAAAS